MIQFKEIEANNERHSFEQQELFDYAWKDLSDYHTGNYAYLEIFDIHTGLLKTLTVN